MFSHMSPSLLLFLFPFSPDRFPHTEEEVDVQMSVYRSFLHLFPVDSFDDPFSAFSALTSYFISHFFGSFLGNKAFKRKKTFLWTAQNLLYTSCEADFFARIYYKDMLPAFHFLIFHLPSENFFAARAQIGATFVVLFSDQRATSIVKESSNSRQSFSFEW